MKKLLGIVVLGLLFNFKAYAGKFGEGPVQLTDGMVNYFYEYLTDKKHKPSVFLLTLDGTDGMYWYCDAPASCSTGSPSIYMQKCSKRTGKQCKFFARKRQIKWKNGINPGKGKVSQIDSKLDLTQLKIKLNELGFYNIKDLTNLENTEKEKIKEIQFPESKIRWTKKRKQNWTDMMNTNRKYKVWVDSLTSKSGTWHTWGWSVGNDSLDKVAKKAFNFCNKYQKEYVKEKKYSEHDICLVTFINGVPTTNEEKIKFANKFYSKKKASEAFEHNLSLLDN